MNASVFAPSFVTADDTPKGLPDSLKRIQDYPDVYFIIDPEHNRLAWANRRGLDFWSVDSRMELKDIPFKAEHPLMKIAHECLSLLQVQADCVFDIMLSGRQHPASRCVFTLHPLPDHRSGILVHILNSARTRPFLFKDQKFSSSGNTDPSNSMPLFEHGTVFPQFQPTQPVSSVKEAQKTPIPETAHQTTPEASKPHQPASDIPQSLTLNPNQTLEELHVSILQINQNGEIVYRNQASQLVFGVNIGDSFQPFLKNSDDWSSLLKGMLSQNRFIGHADLLTQIGTIHCQITCQQYQDSANGKTFFLTVDEANNQVLAETQKAQDILRSLEETAPPSVKNASNTPPKDFLSVVSSPSINDDVTSANQITTTDSTVNLPVPERTIHEVQAVNKATAALNALDAAGIAVLLLNKDGAIQTLSPTALSLLGRHPSELLGQKIVDFVEEENLRLELENLFSRAIKLTDTSFLNGCMANIPQASGDTLSIMMTLRENDNAHEHSFWLVLRDNRSMTRLMSEVTRLKSQVALLSQNNSGLPALPDMISALGHEIRTPLGALIGFADFIRSEPYGPLGNERYVEYIDHIKEAGEFVLNMANDILDYTRLSSGRYDFKKEPVFIETVFQATERMLKGIADKARITIQTSVLSNCPLILSDAQALQQVLLNLTTNAIKASPAGEGVYITAGATRTGKMMVEIFDQGRGMTEDEIHIAQQPFGQALKGVRGGGSGLGLPLARQMVEGLGGKLALESKVGEWTRIRLIFSEELVISGEDEFFQSGD